MLNMFHVLPRCQLLIDGNTDRQEPVTMEITLYTHIRAPAVLLLSCCPGVLSHTNWPQVNHTWCLIDL